MWGKNLDYGDFEKIKDFADDLGIKGNIFFRDDGSMKLTAEAEEKKLLFFVERLKKKRVPGLTVGPMENFSVVWHEPRRNFSNFSVG